MRCNENKGINLQCMNPLHAKRYTIRTVDGSEGAMCDGAADAPSRSGFQIVHEIILDSSSRRRWGKKNRSDGSHDVRKMIIGRASNSKVRSNGIAKTNAIGRHLAMQKDFVAQCLVGGAKDESRCMTSILRHHTKTKS